MKQNRLCPVERAGGLDNRVRRWFQDPEKILRPFITEGMTVVDLGCGPGFFSVAMARMVGEYGRVVAADLQDGMLGKLRSKISGTEFDERIILHKCHNNKIGITGPVDFILAFYMVHEVPDQYLFFKEVESILKPGGLVLVVEPPFHVTNKAFNQTIALAEQAGLTPDSKPRVRLSKAVTLRKTGTDYLQS